MSKWGPICIFCSAPWSDENIKTEMFASSGCETCGYGETIEGDVIISCHFCKKEMYRKEVKERPHG